MSKSINHWWKFSLPSPDVTTWVSVMCAVIFIILVVVLVFKQCRRRLDPGRSVSDRAKMCFYLVIIKAVGQNGNSQAATSLKGFRARNTGNLFGHVFELACLTWPQVDSCFFPLSRTKFDLFVNQITIETRILLENIIVTAATMCCLALSFTDYCLKKQHLWSVHYVPITNT